MSCPGFFRLENLWKMGVIFFDVNLLNFLPQQIVLVSVKIFDNKKKRSKYQNDLMKSISPSGFSIYEYGNLFFSFYSYSYSYLSRVLAQWHRKKTDLIEGRQHLN